MQEKIQELVRFCKEQVERCDNQATRHAEYDGEWYFCRGKIEAFRDVLEWMDSANLF